MNLFMIFLLILPLIFISHHRFQFSAQNSTNNRARKSQKIQTSQMLISLYIMDLPSIRAHINSFYHSKNASATTMPLKMSSGTLGKITTISSATYYKKSYIFHQTFHKAVTILSVPIVTIAANQERSTSSTTRNFRFMLHLPTNSESIKSLPRKPTITNNPYNIIINTYLYLNLSISIFFKTNNQ